MNDYLTYRNNLKLGIVTKPVKEVKPIAKRSDRMKEEMKLYIPAAKAFLSRPENAYCKIQMKGCLQIAVCIHHQSGRIGAKLHDQEDWVPACGICNSLVEGKDQEARNKGFKKSKFN
jgi:hypothetical protein